MQDTIFKILFHVPQKSIEPKAITLSSPASSTSKTEHCDMTEILLKVALNPNKNKQTKLKAQISDESTNIYD